MDWNWFYSAVAQSSAAIVGIFGAFVFTKIINNQAQFNQRRSDVRSLLQDARRLSDEVGNRYFDWYNRRSNEASFKSLGDDLVLEEELRTPEYYFHNFGFSQYQSMGAVISEIENLVEAEKVRRKRPPKATSSSRAGILGNLHSGGIPTIVDPITLARAVDKLEAELDKLDRMAVAVRAHCRKITTFVADSRKHPESSSLITVSVVFSLALFYVGVFYPLAWLPVLTRAEAASQTDADATARLIILASVAALFTGVMVLFLILNLRMRVKETDMTDLGRFAKESDYSEYLGHEADNRKRRKDVV